MKEINMKTNGMMGNQDKVVGKSNVCMGIQSQLILAY